MSKNRLSAFNENREYFFHLHSADTNKIEIEMYSTFYILVKGKNGNWQNHSSNKSEMAPGLINGVVEIVKP